MKIKTIEGHLTQTEKKHIKALFKNDLMCGKIGKKTYQLSEEDNTYTVKIYEKDRGLVPCPGSELRLSIYTHKFQII